MSSPPGFQTIPTWTVDQVRSFIREREPETFTLLDVRQPEEYAEGHLPGARLIPVGELHARIAEVPRTGRPTIVYCRSGMRAGKGTAFLLQAGFTDVWNMAGGILAWNGVVATGAPEAGMSWFEAARDPADYIALAWILERGAQIFYERMAVQFSSSEAGDLFHSLGQAEEHHKESLRAVHASIIGTESDPVPPEEVEARDTMEGGVSIRKTLEWAEQRNALDVLEFAVAMEVNAYDRYQQVAQTLQDPRSREVLEQLAREEKDHLDRLLESFVRLGKDGFLA
jgi:rhodanese-related sulfurtransferase/rubrerythrin